MKLVKKTVHKGWHDFCPPELPGFVRPRSLDEYIIYLRFDDTIRYEIPTDQTDWNKGGGLTSNFFRRAKNSLFFAWRYAPESGLIELTPYQNINYGRVVGDGKEEVLLRCKPGELVRQRFIPINGRTWMTATERYNEDHKLWVGRTAQFTFLKEYRTMWTAGLWFGGADNDGDGYGGVAPQKIRIYYGTQTLRK